jgi:uncharacterized protein (TIGR02302 family)
MITPPRPQDRLDTLLRAVARRRRLARLALWFERAWPAVWPVLGVAGVWLCLALLDLPRMLPGWAHAGLLGGFALLLLAALWRAGRRITVPEPAAADRRMERASGLPHRPLSVLTDRPAQPGAAALWVAHVVRAMDQVGRLRIGLPRPGMAGHDPRALRLGLVVGLAACLGIAGEQAPGRVLRGFVPVFGAVAAPAATQIQAWITPPAYTGQAPVFLKPEGGAVTIPRDSRLVVNVTGGLAAPSLTQGARALAVRALDAASFQAEEALEDSGRLVLMRDGRELAGWDVTVVANVAPEVRFPEPPGGLRARVPQTRLPWEVAHAYGVVGLQAELTLRERPEAPVLVVPIQLPGGSTKAAKGARVQDLTAHPWAGTMVDARLVGRDATGLAGHSETIGFELPERRFQHPVARALIEQRKALTLRPDERGAPLLALEQMARLDEVWKGDPGGFLNLESITRQLRHDRAAGAVDEAQGRMWQLALHLEEGAPERTARALEQARQAVREALEAERRGEEVDRAELDRRMRELQEALQRHMEALAEQARREPDRQNFDPERQNRLDAQDMKRAAEEMREASREDRMPEARDKLAELEKMLEEMKSARQERGKPSERQKARQEKRQRGERQMSAVQDMIKREGALVDNAQQRGGDTPAPRPFMAPRPPPRGAAEDPARSAAQRAQDQRVQQALRRALGELMQQQGDLTGKIPPPLAEADAAMRDAVAALREGRDPAAAQAAQRAIEALQKGGREMSQEMAAQFGRGGEEDGEEEGDESGEGSMMAEGEQDGMGNGPGSQQMGPGDQRADRRGERGVGRGRNVTRRADERRDPLGRHLREGTSGSDESGDVQVPEQMEEARTRAIQEELRRRGADRGRAQVELEYIERLLKQF